MEQQNDSNLIFTIRGAVTGLIAYIILGWIVTSVFV